MFNSENNEELNKVLENKGLTAVSLNDLVILVDQFLTDPESHDLAYVDLSVRKKGDANDPLILRVQFSKEQLSIFDIVLKDRRVLLERRKNGTGPTYTK